MASSHVFSGLLHAPGGVFLSGILPRIDIPPRSSRPSTKQTTAQANNVVVIVIAIFGHVSTCWWLVHACNSTEPVLKPMVDYSSVLPNQSCHIWLLIELLGKLMQLLMSFCVLHLHVCCVRSCVCTCVHASPVV